mgnify:CR=1 FL=1
MSSHSEHAGLSAALSEHASLSPAPVGTGTAAAKGTLATLVSIYTTVSRFAASTLDSLRNASASTTTDPCSNGSSGSSAAEFVAALPRRALDFARHTAQENPAATRATAAMVAVFAASLLLRATRNAWRRYHAIAPANTDAAATAATAQCPAPALLLTDALHARPFVLCGSTATGVRELAALLRRMFGPLIAVIDADAPCQALDAGGLSILTVACNRARAAGQLPILLCSSLSAALALQVSPLDAAVGQISLSAGDASAVEAVDAAARRAAADAFADAFEALSAAAAAAATPALKAEAAEAVSAFATTATGAAGARVFAPSPSPPPALSPAVAEALDALPASSVLRWRRVLAADPAALAQECLRALPSDPANANLPRSSSSKSPSPTNASASAQAGPAVSAAAVAAAAAAAEALGIAAGPGAAREAAVRLALARAVSCYHATVSAALAEALELPGGEAAAGAELHVTVPAHLYGNTWARAAAEATLPRVLMYIRGMYPWLAAAQKALENASANADANTNTPANAPAAVAAPVQKTAVAPAPTTAAALVAAAAAKQAAAEAVARAQAQARAVAVAQAAAKAQQQQQTQAQSEDEDAACSVSAASAATAASSSATAGASAAATEGGLTGTMGRWTTAALDRMIPSSHSAAAPVSVPAQNPAATTADSTAGSADTEPADAQISEIVRRNPSPGDAQTPVEIKSRANDDNDAVDAAAGSDSAAADSAAADSAAAAGADVEEPSLDHEAPHAPVSRYSSIDNADAAPTAPEQA